MRGRERRPVVGVMGSGSQPHAERVGALGRWLAREGVHLLTGGGGGVMESASRAFFEVPDREGLVIGVLPGSSDAAGYGPQAGYPNRWVEIAIRTHLPLTGERGTDPRSRNAINVLSSDVLVALPGGGRHRQRGAARASLRAPAGRLPREPLRDRGSPRGGSREIVARRGTGVRPEPARRDAIAAGRQ